MPLVNIYTVYASDEQPEGQIEHCGLTAESPEAAVAMVIEKYGNDADWQVRRFDARAQFIEGEAAFIFEQEAPKRGPQWSANLLYKLPGKPTTDPWAFHGFLDFDEHRIPSYPDPTDANGYREISKNTRVSLRVVSDPYIDGERCHTLGTLWLDDRPFAVTQQAGRGGRDHDQVYVTSAAVLGEALGYLYSLYEPLPEDEVDRLDIIDPDKLMRELTTFYSGAAELPEQPAT